MTQIGQAAFFGCKGITLTELPGGVTQIDDSAFANCSGITLTALPGGVTQIEQSAFANCSSITLTELPDGVTQIGNYAFSGCTKLDSLTIPASVESIGNNAFLNCTNLKKVIFEGKAAPTFGTDVFAGITPQPAVLVPEGATGYPSDLKPQTGVLTVTFDSNGTGGTSDNENDMKAAIEAALAALPTGSDKTTVTTIKLTGDATEITGYNWKYLIDQYYKDSSWASLTALDLSDMTCLEAIRNGTISQTGLLTKLKTLILPNNVKQIGDYAFWKCTAPVSYTHLVFSLDLALCP